MAPTKIKITETVEPLSRHLQVTNESGHPTREFINLWQRVIDGSISCGSVARAMLELLAKEILGTPGEIEGGGKLSDPGNIQFSLSNTGVTAGEYGYSNMAVALVIDKNGRITNASQVPIGALDINKATFGDLPADRISGEISPSQIAENAITSRELAIPSLGGEGKIVAGAKDGKFLWEKQPDPAIEDDQGAIFTLNHYSRLYGYKAFLPLDKKLYGDDSRYKIIGDGEISLYNPHQSKYLVIIAVGVERDTYDAVDHELTIVLQRKDDRGVWQDIASRYEQNFLDGQYRLNRSYLPTTFYAKEGKQVSLRVKLLMIPDTGVGFYPSSELPPTMVLIQPFHALSEETIASDIFMQLTETRILKSTIDMDVIGDMYRSFTSETPAVKTLYGPNKAAWLGAAHMASSNKIIITKEKGKGLIKVDTVLAQIGFLFDDPNVARSMKNKQITVHLNQEAANVESELSILGYKGAIDRFLWPPYDETPNVPILYPDWTLIEKRDTPNGLTRADFDLPDTDYDAIAIVHKFKEKGQVEALYYNQFYVEMKDPYSLQDIKIREQDPIVYSLLVPPKAGPKPQDNIFGLEPFSFGEFDGGLGKGSILFRTPTCIAWSSSLEKDTITGSLKNPHSGELHPILDRNSVSTRVEYIYTRANDRYVDVGNSQLLHCQTWYESRHTGDIPSKVEYLTFFNADGATDPVLLDKIDNNEWLVTNYDNVASITAPTPPDRLYFVFPDQNTPPEYYFIRYPKGIRETWEEVQGLIAKPVRVFKCPNPLHEKIYSLRILEVF